MADKNKQSTTTTEEESSGTGVTSSALMKKLVVETSRIYGVSLVRMSAKIERRVAKNMEAAFADGMSTMLLHLKQMGVVRVLTDEEVDSIRAASKKEVY